MWLLIPLLASADLAPPYQGPACEADSRCHGQTSQWCDDARDADRCAALSADGWERACRGLRSVHLYCRPVSPSPALPDPPADVAAALARAGGPRVRLVGAVEARVAPEAAPLALGPFPAEGSEPWFAVSDGRVRVVVGTDVAVLAEVPAASLAPVVTSELALVPADATGAGVRLAPGARVVRLDGGAGARVLGPIETEGPVPPDAIGAVFTPSPAPPPGDRCAAVGASLRAEDGRAIGRIVGEGPCVPGFTLLEERGDRVLVRYTDAEIDARGWLSPDEVTLPIPGLRGLGPFGGLGGGGGASSDHVYRGLPGATYLYDAPGGAVIGRADTDRRVRALEARADGWWSAEAQLSGVAVGFWVAPDGARWASPVPPRADRAGVAAAAVPEPAPATADGAALVQPPSPPAGCGCAAAAAPAGVFVGGIAIVAALGARRRRR